MSSMTVRRKIKVTAAAFFLSIFISTKSYASDITVTCAEDASCSTSPSGSLFSESGMLPGDSVVKTISVINNDSDDTCYLNMRTENETQNPVEFPSRLFTVIRKKPSSILSGTYASVYEAASTKNLQDIFDLSSLYFEHLPPGGSLTEYEWIVTFDQSAGNEFQEAETLFDFDLVFSCGHDDDNGDDDNGDDDDDDDHHHHDDDDDDDIIFGDVAGVTSFWFPPPLIAGTSVDEPADEPVVQGISDEPGDVSGIADCTDPWWWMLVFIVQIIIQLIVFLMSRNRDSKTVWVLLQLVISIIFIYVFWKYFCPTWDIYLSALIGLIFMALTLLSSTDDSVTPPPNDFDEEEQFTR